MKYIVDIKGDIEGDYDIVGKYEERCEVNRMDDLISRQWLTECVTEGWIKFDTEKDENRFIHLVRDIAPSAESERKKGKWIRHFDGNEWYWYCSSCKEQWYEEDLWMGGNSFPNFCPNCGADMREGDAE